MPRDTVGQFTHAEARTMALDHEDDLILPDLEDLPVIE